MHHGKSVFVNQGNTLQVNFHIKEKSNKKSYEKSTSVTLLNDVTSVSLLNDKLWMN